MDDYADDNDNDNNGGGELPAVGILIACEDEFDAERAWDDLARLGYTCHLWRRDVDGGTR